MSQQAEKRIPADYIYRIEYPVKIFGFQYKALYALPGRDHWRLKQDQHRRLSRTSWISYALSELRENRDHLNALHALRIREANFPYQANLYLENRGPIRRWWTFYELLKSCSLGLYLSNRSDLERAFVQYGIADYTQNDLRELDIIVMSLVRPQIIRMSELTEDLVRP